MDLQSLTNMGLIGSLMGGQGMGLASGLMGGGGLGSMLGGGGGQGGQSTNSQPFAQNPGDSMYSALFSPSLLSGLVPK